MMYARWLLLGLAGLIGFSLAPATGRAQDKSLEAKLPAPVKKSFRAKFPKAEIEKLDVEEEDGVTVYDLEFRDGTTEKETDITADGTMLEFTVVIDEKQVPEAAMRPIQKAAEGATMKRVEQIEISFETKDGKTIKLPRTVTHYAVELSKGGKTAEIVVAPDGKVLEPARWGGDEKEITLEQVPKTVMDAAKARFPGAKIREASKETDDDKTVFELEMTHEDHKMDVTFQEDGTLVLVETQVAEDNVPSAVSLAVKEKYPGAKINVVESVKKGPQVKKEADYYEFHLTTADRKSAEVEVDAKGKILKTEEKTEQDREKEEDKSKG